MLLKIKYTLVVIAARPHPLAPSKEGEMYLHSPLNISGEEDLLLRYKIQMPT
jgi:hypothetical protein